VRQAGSGCAAVCNRAEASSGTSETGRLSEGVLPDSSPEPFIAEQGPGRPQPATDATRERFRALVQSPLRAALLRYFYAHPGDRFDVNDLMQAFGRLRVDTENCLRELVVSGLVARLPGTPLRYSSPATLDESMAELVREYVCGTPQTMTEEFLPAVQRFRDMIGRDEKMAVVFEAIRTAARTDLPVLILGPTGAGKEVVARAIHEMGNRRTGRLQAVNCAALPESLFESEMFGYERGAFTGAGNRKLGRVELADRGTLFLDEIGDLPLVSQVKLLRVVEEHRIERLGGEESKEVDFRLICATHQPLDQLVRERRFREDLYYRINGLTIRLPSLRERPGDIPVLAERFLAAYCADHGLPRDAKRLSRDATDRLLGYAWPGNIRELEATLSRAALNAPDVTILPEHIDFLNAHDGAEAPAVAPMLASLRDVERAHILRVLVAVSWNKKRAAQVLEIGRETLYRKIEQFGLTPDA
jgi:transcriptional regulator with PAS, ATPase and Fis domain